MSATPELGRIGYGLPTVMATRTLDVSALTRLAEQAAGHGFATLWTGDHLLQPHPMYEPVGTLATLAARVPDVRWGTSVLLAGLRPPERVAREVRTLAELTQGRLELGVGAGGDAAIEAAAAGTGRRGPALDRALERIQAACGAGMPRVWAGGRADAALRRAERHGGWLAYLESPAGFARKRASMAEGTRTAVVLLASVTHGEAEQAEAVGFVRRMFRGAEAALLKLGVVGGEEEVRRRAEAFLDSGCDHLILWPLGGEPEQQLARFADVRAALAG